MNRRCALHELISRLDQKNKRLAFAEFHRSIRLATVLKRMRAVYGIDARDLAQETEELKRHSLSQMKAWTRRCRTKKARIAELERNVKLTLLHDCFKALARPVLPRLLADRL